MARNANIITIKVTCLLSSFRLQFSLTQSTSADPRLSLQPRSLVSPVFYRYEQARKHSMPSEEESVDSPSSNAVTFISPGRFFYGTCVDGSFRLEHQVIRLIAESAPHRQ